jgi:hypothetical protein
MVFKYVIVDSHMNVVDKGAMRIQGIAYPDPATSPSTSNPVILTPKMSSGKYRIYYTLNGASSGAFYKSWGNIEKL